MYTGQLADAACRASGTNTGNLSITFSAWVRLAAAFRSGVGRLNVRLPWSPWCALALSLTCVGNAAASIDICSQPEAERHVAVAYYDQAESDFEGGTGRTSRVNYKTDLLLEPNDSWAFGFGHRSTILKVDGISLQTNGYLHSFFFPVHKTQRSENRGFRISFAPALSGSSNVTKDAGQYSRDSFQLLAAVVWQRQLSRRLGLRYGLCGDHRLGGYQVYPLIAFEWQPHPRWAINLGFPAAQLSYKVSTRVSSYLRISPDGNEWHVKDKSLERQSQLIYEAYLLEWAFRWRVLKDISLTVSVGREFDARYEMTLADNSRIRVSNDPATRLGLALAWFF